MSRAERRSLVLLFALGVAGHLARAASGVSREPTPIDFPLDSAGDGDPLAHRDSSRAMGRALADGELVDPDRAGAMELQRLPGVGPTLAKRIVADREIHGAFGGTVGLDRVPGIGPALLARLAGHLTFSGMPADTERGDVPPQLDLNRATVAQLDGLPGIGMARARAIVAFRDSAGPFRQVSDLRLVHGLSAALIGRIVPRLTLR